MAPGNFNYSGNTFHVLRIINMSLTKFLEHGYHSGICYQCHIDICVCHSNVTTSQPIVFHVHWRHFLKIVVKG